MLKIWDFIYKQALLAGMFLFLLSLSGSGPTYAASSRLSTANSIAGHYLAARFAQSQGEMEIAADHYKRALAQEPMNQELLQKTYEFMLLSGDVRKAAQLAKRYSGADDEGKSYTMVHLLEVVTVARKGDFATADEILTAIYNDRENADDGIIAEITAPILLGWAKAGQDKYPEAIRWVNKPVEENEIFKQILPFIPYQEAAINNMAGNREPAEAEFARIADGPASLRAARAAAVFYKGIGQEDKALEILQKYAASHLDIDLTDKKYAGMMKKLLPGKDDKNRRNHIRLGMAETLLENGGLLYSRNAMDSAAMYFRMALFLSPEMDEAKILLANVMEEQGRFGDAIEMFGQIPRDSLFHRKAQIATALNYNKDGDNDKARRMLRDIADSNKSSADSLLNLGDILVAGDKFEEAAEVYGEAMERIGDPEEGNWPVFYARGICYERLGQWEKAETDFNRALELSPKQPDVLNYLGYSWLMFDRNLDKALEILEVAVSARPDDAHIIDSYGWALFKLGRFEEATDYLEKANLIMPHDPTTNDHLGDIYWRTGRFTEAKYQWERALTMEPKPEEVKKIKAKLKDGLPELDPVAMVSASEEAEEL